MHDVDDKLVVMFADITGSTMLYEQKGDREALRLVSQSLNILIEVTKACGGTHVKTIGDELMSTFVSPDAAARAAIDMQERHQDVPLAIKIGFHFGPVISKSDDVFGDAVNTAARMVSLAKRDEIITTEVTVQAFSPTYQEASRHLDTTTVKGKEELIPIYQLIWQDDDLTIMPADMDSNMMTATGGIPQLTLTHKGFEIEVGSGAAGVSIGRGDANALVVLGTTVSRHHAKVEFSRGHFLYSDQSSNGTYIVNDEKPDKPVFVKRETINITGSGYIFLGHKPKSEGDSAIRYQIEQP